ncbi:ABC1 kinase family protein [Ornithinimicrobium avium]|uniref:AarF/ABC1/UbiB kinase family protein n=1 Tax=Ornithinimicrobium avium TaxID=2283195 RepID=A0A345NK11_9MICO|nr:AarF/UbiB family protein [Ornithinimicrobium avium]AXH95369.1 AarF/ABC1/UbiB kinase family protein [Ornithinimicrobium avium]
MAGHLQRYREITGVLARYGLHATAVQAGLARWLPYRADQVDAGTDVDVRPELLVRTFEELGTTFIKLGQLVSSRPDVFPEAYCTAFAKLTDAAVPVPFDAVRAAVHEDFGAGVDELYAWFDPVPLATASIGQAHRARLHDGRSVVVKVRKPGVVDQVRTDLEILRNLAGHLSRNSQLFSDLDLVGLVEEFSRSLRAELDYLTEARACEEFAENLRGNPGVHVPWVDWSTTTSRVLTMEELSGIRIDDVPALDVAGIDRPDLAHRAVAVLMRMVFEDGVFHADPHAGNLFVEQDGTIGVIDFGMVGRVSPAMRRDFARMIVSLFRQDADGLVSALLQVAPPRGALDRSRLRRDVARLTGWLDGRALAAIQVDAVADQIFTLVRHHRLALPPEVVQIFRMLIIADGLGRRLHPGFDLTDALYPFAQRLIEERLSPRQVAGRLGSATMAAAELGLDLPAYARTLIERIDSGGVDVNIRAGELEPLVERMERTGDRVVAALVVAAMITGGTNVLVAYKDRLGRFAGPLVAGGGAALTAGSAYLAWTGRPRRIRPR